MFTFITSVRHPKNSFYYERVWDLLRDTLFSVCSQTDKDFRVIVVCNRILDDFSDNHRIKDHVEFVEVGFDSPSLADGPVTGVPACNYDRGLKFVVGLIAAEKYDPEYVMFFDADDFISDKIVSSVKDMPGRMGWWFDRGVYVQNYKITHRVGFRETCGTSHILNYRTLITDISMDKLSVESSAKDIRDNVHPFFLKGVLGCHMNYETYFFNCYDSLEKWPNVTAAAYNMGTGENHSGKDSKCGPGWFSMRKPSTKLDADLYRLHLPLINHKRQLIPITLPDDNCKQAMVDTGLYNPVELRASEVRDIYGQDTCDSYTSFAFVVNPWERLVSMYFRDFDKRASDTISFEDYVRTTNVRKQQYYLGDCVDHVFCVEDRHSLDSSIFKGVTFSDTIKTYPNHYSDYYDDETREIVAKSFSEDIELGGYVFENGTSVNPDFIPDPISYDHNKVPNIFHFSFGMSNIPEEFTFVQYLAIKTAIHYNAPDAVYFHYHSEPYGVWWDLIKPYLTMNKVDLVHEIFGNPVVHYAHMSDVVRLLMLYKYGGVYLDLDTITVSSFENLYDIETSLGIQDSARIFMDPALYDKYDYYGLCNATIVAKPGSEFILDWIYSYRSFNSAGRDAAWDWHSVVVPNIIANSKHWPQNKLKILGSHSFFWPLWDKINDCLLSEDSAQYEEEYRGAYSVHLWNNEESVNDEVVTPEYVSTSKSMYAKFASPAYSDMSQASISLVFLTHSSSDSNRTDLLVRCLKTYVALLDSRDDIAEILIHDNASTDSRFLDYLSTIASNDKIHVTFCEENLGVAGGRDLLFKEVKGDLVFSLDSDSSVTGDVDSFISNAKSILSDTQVGITGVCGSVIHSLDKPFDHTDIADDSCYEYLTEVSHISGCCQMFRRSILDEVSIDLEYQPFWYEDTDFCFQLKELGYRVFKFNSGAVFQHDWGGTGNTLFPGIWEDKFKYFRHKWLQKFNKQPCVYKSASVPTIDKKQFKGKQILLHAEKVVSNYYKSYHDELLELKPAQDCRAEKLENYFDDIECELLYMFVREFKPKSVIEFSPYEGWSTTWLLEAMNKNGVGSCTSYDLVGTSKDKLTELEVDTSRWTLVVDDVTKHFHKFGSPDFIFIDSDHSAEFAKKYIREVLLPLKHRSKSSKPVLVFIHDIFHTSWYSEEQQVVKSFLNNIHYVTGNELCSLRPVIDKLRNKYGLGTSSDVNPGVFFIL